MSLLARIQFIQEGGAVDKPMVYRPGQIVRGVVLLTNLKDKPKRLHSLSVKLVGEEYVKFKKTYCRPYFCCCILPGCYHFEYRCQKKEKYFQRSPIVDEEVVLLGECMVNPGQIRVPFKFDLPSNYCPTSFNDALKKQSWVQYYVAPVTVTNGVFKKERVGSVFEVRGYQDVQASWPHLCEPGQMTLSSSSGKKVARVEVLKQGFGPGESIRFKRDVFSASAVTHKTKRREKPITVRVVPTDLQAFDMVEDGDESGMQVRTWVWEDHFDVSSNLHPTNLAGARLISLNYVLQFVLKGIGKEEVILAIGTDMVNGSTGEQDAASVSDGSSIVEHIEYARSQDVDYTHNEIPDPDYA